MLKTSQYLRLYAEPEARLLAANPPDRRYRFCLVIPAYREPATFADSLTRLASQVPDLLAIIVLNQPDTDVNKHCNDDLRQVLERMPVAVGYDRSVFAEANSKLLSLTPVSDLLLVERPAPLPARDGVGLARKLGCDIAVALHQSGRIGSRWLHSGDADAQFPPAHFENAEQQPGHAVAITHAFVHKTAGDIAMTLYELRLHYYVLGLRSAGSPYAFHTLGSCLSIDVKAYQQVRGFPRRAAAEDFYLLNKVAKLGPVCTPGIPLISIAARHSDRVPFGTGPALQKLAASANPINEPLFYHPSSFGALRALLCAIPGLYQSEQALPELAAALQDHGPTLQILEELGIQKCLEHCRRQSRDEATYKRHFMQWFDGFRTLKLLHGLRERGWHDLSLSQSLEHPGSIWPQIEGASATDPALLLRSCQAALGWTVPAQARSTTTTGREYPPAGSPPGS